MIIISRKSPARPIAYGPNLITPGRAFTRACSRLGLNVHLTPATSSETVIAQQAIGQFDITGGDYVSYIQAQRNWDSGQRASTSSPNVLAANLDIFAEASVMGPGAQGIYTMPNSPVATLADLKNQTIAVNAPQNILYLLAASVLAEHGVPPRRCTSPVFRSPT